VNEIHHLIDQRFRTREQLEAYMRAVNKTEEELHQELHDELQPLATTRVKRGLVLGKVAEEEKFEVSAAEVDADIERMVKSAGSEAEKLQNTLNTPEVRESIADRLLTNKTVDRLLEIARGQTEAPSEKEDAK
jgi:FKBP-type peptidyl-prolyl cis-trans isomerase (trigger factor)